MTSSSPARAPIFPDPNIEIEDPEDAAEVYRSVFNPTQEERAKAARLFKSAKALQQKANAKS